MTRKALLAIVALVIATTLTLINSQRKRTIGPQISSNPTSSAQPKPRIETQSVPPPSPAPPKAVANTSAPQASDFSAVQAEALRSLSSTRIDTVDFQSSPRGYESSLSIDGLPLVGSRLLVERGAKGNHIALIPHFELAATAVEHSRQHHEGADAVALSESLQLVDCEMISLGAAKAIWFYTGGATNIVPAYSVEAFYRCGRTRKREDWIYADPSLEKLGTVKKKI